MGALSADGSFAFDERANGFVLAEAVSVYILKRLSDAERDGDKIYALIDAVGSSSDGKGKGIAAPNPKGQKLAIEHAFSQVEYTPGDIDFIEAHGTATKVGDAAEVQVLDEEFSPFLPEGKKIGLTSVKSQIGHAKSAAGAVSIAKTALALSKKVLPGSINCEKENPAINLEKFYVIKKSSEWKKEEGLRRAAVSAFGFGGTNFHVLMEEYTGRDQDHFVGREEPGPEGYFSPAMVKEDPCMPFDKLQPEAITIWGDTPAEVIRAAQREAREIFSRMPSQYPAVRQFALCLARTRGKNVLRTNAEARLPETAYGSQTGLFSGCNHLYLWRSHLLGGNASGLFQADSLLVVSRMLCGCRTLPDFRLPSSHLVAKSSYRRWWFQT